MSFHCPIKTELRFFAQSAIKAFREPRSCGLALNMRISQPYGCAIQALDKFSQTAFHDLRWIGASAPEPAAIEVEPARYLRRHRARYRRWE